MSDNEVEKFEITDYDLEHEFSQNRPGRRQTKEQQIYGMWAQESGGEEEGDADPGSSVPPPSRLSVLRGGLNFVSGGIQQAGKKKDATKGDGSDGEESESELSSRPMFGAGGAADSSDEDAPRQLPASFGGKKSSSQPSYTSSKRQDIAGMRRGGGRSSGGSSLLGSGLGDWEKYTSGIGSKLLKKMGFEEGKGLGKNLQGISTPVEANKRKGKGAIGFYGSERSERSLKDFPTHDSDEEEKEKFKDLLQQWKKTGGKKKIKYIYKSAEEVIQEGRTKKLKPTDDSHITKTKVIDMTGPETRVLSSYHAIAGQKNLVDEYEEDKKKKYEHFDLPELLHNLQILLEKCEDDIIRNARTVERESDRVVHLTHEQEKYETLLEREKKELEGLDQALALVESLETRHKEQTLTLSEATSIFSELKSDYQKIYNTFEIPYLAPTYITPLLKELLRTWNPLAQPAGHKEVFATWQRLVEVGDSQQPQQQQQPDGSVPLDPYHHLVWETWASAVRSAIMGPWEPRDCSPLLAVLEAWNVPLVPMWIQAHLLQHVILPRITRAVQNWNPLQDTVPIHTWLHPWLPLLVDNLQSVYPVIRQKLSAALVHWHPNDRSAKMVLQPWKRVFSDISMTTLLQTNIQPKLETALLEMAITPHNQNLDPWHWFLDWDDLLPPQITLDIMERCFFPQWYQALGAWLSSNPPHQEVIAWYKGWRDLIPKSLSNHLQVRQKFQQALEVCSRALSYQLGASDQFNLLLAGLDKLNEPPPPPPLGSPPQQRSKDWADIISSARRETLSMREVVERRCQERGIVFVPMPDRKHEARPVYRCGKLNVSFNKNIIYVQTERGWMPKSLTTLLDDA
ncbi:tuftelin-interacting protein 11-like [Portunus trituberculatus]|uniref:Tuftelin-interacting protein 11 n=1 Tax=Portunus trituberculatus TaxID=210409 RepID=A0A5B7CEH6_PORTR|nr:tuftelin-interacting protein 11-like [Portunus trituberculatus]XP_045110596.1 tuftelin-interacting protein 11-like [Portunus trituberculatus]MPC07610.1 Tuftelin-interacting protein 11 [Portunus trituberculatus]